MRPRREKTLKAIISVKPEYADRIASGEKTVEYRKTDMTHSPQALVIWRTGKGGRIIGEVPVTGTIWGSPQEVWEKTEGRGGITKEAYDTYFEGRDIAYAYKLGPFRAFEKELPLGRLGLNRPPQSFAYVWHMQYETGAEDWVRPRFCH